MDFNQVRYFLALADTLNFTRAAEQCYVSQPALTQAIKRLEDELGGELISRDGRETALTALGKSLRGHFEAIDRTRHLVRSTAKAVTTGEVAELNIGIMCTVGPRLIAPMLDDFQQHHPMASLLLHDVAPEAIPEMLLSGALDAVFCARGEVADNRLRYLDLYQEAIVVAFPKGHPFAKKAAVSMDDIAGERYLDRLHCEFRDGYLDYCEQHELKTNVVLRSQREDWVQSLIRDGAGVSVVPRYSLLEPELDFRPVDAPGMQRQVELAIVEQTPLLGALQLFSEHAKTFSWALPD